MKEELAIHHNHYLAQQLKEEEHSFLIEVGDYVTPMAESNEEDFILQPSFLEKKTSGDTKNAIKELFQEEKTEWMGWERHIIEQVTDKTAGEHPTNSLGETLSKLIQWKTLTYSIFDDFRVYELIEDKILQLHKKLDVSVDLAQAVLVTNSWDEAEAEKNCKDPSYISTQFKFDSSQGKERIQKLNVEQEFFCDTCYDSVSLD